MSQLPQWFTGLDDEDLQFLKRFLLASGSLKAVAKEYNISYPTVRARLDRLIAKVRVSDETMDSTAFYRRIRILVADGKLVPEVARVLLEAHNEEIKDLRKGASNE
ncbi:MAG TPA: DUF2089 family protein [Candidatus Hydrogenedentes bacterium]|nr:DUF2089 family protein [Candidatus Hydrogenedentota bacterium]HQH52793.1 DUF2089 family protein [Candidatus Hydrogenedentota bacterium]HQM47787.1 DUF2089 family protein [Candidatus Hydrogenedentota bacterium]